MNSFQEFFYQEFLENPWNLYIFSRALRKPLTTLVQLVPGKPLDVCKQGIDEVNWVDPSHIMYSVWQNCNQIVWSISQNVPGEAVCHGIALCKIHGKVSLWPWKNSLKTKNFFQLSIKLCFIFSSGCSSWWLDSWKAGGRRTTTCVQVHS